VPEFLVEFLAAFAASGAAPDFAAFLDTQGRMQAAALAEAHQHLPEFEDAPVCYTDWGGREAFALTDHGPGECGGGPRDPVQRGSAGARGTVRRGPPSRAGASNAAKAQRASREADLRDTSCPVTYARAKLLLAAMNPGERLRLLVTQDDAERVPASLEQDGHSRLSTERFGDDRRVLIERGPD
jgi:TusA-related sulfurtransferase